MRMCRKVNSVNPDPGGVWYWGVSQQVRLLVSFGVRNRMTKVISANSTLELI